METKFTPGPWTVEPVRDNNGKPYATSYEAWVFVEPSVCGLWAKEGCTLADAHLIAAAPELYEALSEFVAVCDAAPPVEFINEIGRVVVKARAALKKARGEV